MIGVLLALGTALAYGVADFVGGAASRRASPWAVTVAAQAGSLLTVLVIVAITGGSPTAADLAWGLLAGAGNALGTLSLYRGLGRGRMGLVAPLSAVGAALVPVLAGLLLGERPSALAWAGIATAGPGIWLVARDEAHDELPPAGRGREAGAIVDGVLAGLGFGLLFAALAQVSPTAGTVPLIANQVMAGCIVVAAAATLRTPWVPRTRHAWTGAIGGLLGGSATATFLLATRHGDLTVVSVLASLYPAITVLLAVLALRERISAAQGVGLVLCALTVTFVAAG